MSDGIDPVSGEAEEKTAAARRRLVGFGLHLVAYFVAMMVLVPLNLWLSPEEIWFILPMIGWGSVLALHVAYVMGLFAFLRSD